MAVFYGNVDVVRQFLARPTLDVNASLPLVPDSWTVNDYVRLTGEESAINELDPQLIERKRTILFVAANVGNLEMVEMIVGHPEIDTNKPDSATGGTPLTMACEKGHLPVVEFLLSCDQKVDANQAKNSGASTRVFQRHGSRRNQSRRLI